MKEETTRTSASQGIGMGAFGFMSRVEGVNGIWSERGERRMVRFV